MRIRSLTFIATFAVAAAVLAANSDMPLAQEIGKTRPLIVIAASADDPVLVKLKTSLNEPANQRAFAERDMVLFTVVNNIGQRDGKNLGSNATAALLRELKPDPAPTVILVGKDGEKKLERRGPIELKELFGIIDAMPMRRSETDKAHRPLIM